MPLLGLGGEEGEGPTSSEGVGGGVVGGGDGTGAVEFVGGGNGAVAGGDDWVLSLFAGRGETGNVTGVADSAGGGEDMEAA